MKEILKYLGIILLIIGVIILSVAVFTENQTNTKLAISLGFIVVGFIGHIILNKAID